MNRKHLSSLLVATLACAGSALADPAGRGRGHGFGRDRGTTILRKEKVVVKGNGKRKKKTVVVERPGRREKTVVTKDRRGRIVRKTKVEIQKPWGRRGRRVARGHREHRRATPARGWAWRRRPAARRTFRHRPAPRPVAVQPPAPRRVVVHEPAPRRVVRQPTPQVCTLPPPVTRPAPSGGHGSQVQKAKVHTRNTLLALTLANEGLNRSRRGRRDVRKVGMGLLALNEIFR